MVWLLRVKIKGEQGCGQKTSVKCWLNSDLDFFSGGNHITDQLAIYKLGGGCDQGRYFKRGRSTCGEIIDTQVYSCYKIKRN